jgi:hypothetical protein
MGMGWAMTCPCREALKQITDLPTGGVEAAFDIAAEALAKPCGCEESEAEIRRLREGWDGWQKQALAAEEDLRHAVYLAEHLWQMIPQEVWREHGAEYQGQYEGDYHAEKVREELALLRERSAAELKSPRQHLKDTAALVRAWPPYMRTHTSAYAKWKRRDDDA